MPSSTAPAVDRRFLLIGVAVVLLGRHGLGPAPSRPRPAAWPPRRPAARSTLPRPRRRASRPPVSAIPAPIATPTASSTSASTGCWRRSAAAAWPRSIGPSAGTDVYALKRPLPAFLEEPEFLERFLREAEIGRTLHHPNIVRILERGEVAGVPFFTMELVPGETLQALLQRVKALEPRPATQVVVQVAEALDYAHLKGVVHRDLKPSNVMVLPDGAVKVMDYGIARARRFEGLTVTGAFLGSPEYVAPETIEGRGTDARSDLYSLGVIFYETLAGRRPFVADTPFAILHKHLTEEPPPPSALRPGVPAELDRIVLRLLSKTPGERYAAAEDLVLDLRDFLNRAA